MPETPDTLGYLILGLVVTFGILGVFVALIAARWRALKRDLRTLETLRREDGE